MTNTSGTKTGASNLSSVQLSCSKQSIQEGVKQLSTHKKINLILKCLKEWKHSLAFRIPDKLQMTDAPENSKAHVVSIHPSSTCWGKIKLGDWLIAISGIAVKNTEDLERGDEKCEKIIKYTRVGDVNSILGYTSGKPCNGIYLVNIESRKVRNIDKSKKCSGI